MCQKHTRDRCMIARFLRVKNVPPKESRLFVDSGYQGIAEIHKNADFPYKSSKNNPLDEEKKEYNTKPDHLNFNIREHIAVVWPHYSRYRSGEDGRLDGHRK